VRGLSVSRLQSGFAAEHGAAIHQFSLHASLFDRDAEAPRLFRFSSTGGRESPPDR